MRQSESDFSSVFRNDKTIMLRRVSLSNSELGSNIGSKNLEVSFQAIEQGRRVGAQGCRGGATSAPKAFSVGAALQ